MAKKIGKRTITVVRKPKVDRLSDTPAGEAVEHQIAGCVIAPRTSFEEGRGWVIVEGLMVVAPYDSDILADDRVRVETGEPLWNVGGEPGNYEDKKARGKATIFYLTRVT